MAPSRDLDPRRFRAIPGPAPPPIGSARAGIIGARDLFLIT
jgi:hypothetical protein